MTRPDLKELGLRAVACKNWRWMPGMCVFGTSVQPSAWVGKIRLTELHEKPVQLRDPWPDFSDPATLGCLLALVRERWQLPLRTPGTCPGDDGHPDFYTMRIYEEDAQGDTEAECLVNALEMEYPE